MGTLGALGIGAIGLLVLMYGMMVSVRIHRARAWPIVKGTIIASEERSVDGRYGPTFRNDIRYSYRVGGEEWEGTRAHFLGSAYTSTVFSEPGAAYAVGDVVDVHYDPAIPSHAVLKVGPAFGAGAIAVIGLLLLAMGVALALGAAGR